MKKIVVMIGVFFFINLQAETQNFLEYYKATHTADGTPTVPIWNATSQEKVLGINSCHKIVKENPPEIDASIKKWSLFDPSVSREQWVGSWLWSCFIRENGRLAYQRNAAAFADEHLHKIVQVHATGLAGTVLKSLSKKAVSMRQGFVDASATINMLTLFGDQKPYKNLYSSQYMPGAFGKVLNIMKEKIDTQVLDAVAKAGKTFGIQIAKPLVTSLENQIKLLTDTTDGKSRYVLLKCPNNPQCNAVIEKLTSITNQFFNTVINQVNKVLQSMQK
jgi:hypothetical protein